MKKKNYPNSSSFTSLFTFSLLLLFTFYSQSARACVDPDTIATLTLNYSEDLSNVEIRIGNLKLETEAPNTFCSCGLSSETEVFTYVTYIAIVYQGTNDVYPNFIPFEQTSPADAAWDGSQPALPDWNGYVAEVINGLVADDAVEMIIRAEAPPGVLVELQGSPQNDTSALYYQTWLGTDAWDPSTMDLIEAHQAIRTFAFMSDITVNVLTNEDPYFDNLDADIINSIYEVGKSSVQTARLSPNPVNDFFDLSFELNEAADLNLVIYDMTGRAVHQMSTQRYQPGEHILHISLAGILPKSGVYIASLQSSSGQTNLKFVVQ
ncbi:MAG: T9SS type A sorting domain-containing protein [Saprospiraceae bacterium]